MHIFGQTKQFSAHHGRYSAKDPPRAAEGRSFVWKSTWLAYARDLQSTWLYVACIWALKLPNTARGVSGVLLPENTPIWKICRLSPRFLSGGVYGPPSKPSLGQRPDGQWALFHWVCRNTRCAKQCRVGVCADRVAVVSSSCCDAPTLGWNRRVPHRGDAVQAWRHRRPCFRHRAPSSWRAEKSGWSTRTWRSIIWSWPPITKWASRPRESRSTSKVSSCCFFVSFFLRLLEECQSSVCSLTSRQCANGSHDVTCESTSNAVLFANNCCWQGFFSAFRSSARAKSSGLI